MGETPPVHFGPFRLEPDTGCLWQGTARLKLKPKVFALLEYLVARAGRLVSKEELFAAIWPSTVVGLAGSVAT